MRRCPSLVVASLAAGVDNACVSSTAVFGLIGVLLGSVITAFGTIYREQVTSKREREARAHQAAQEKHAQFATFQRESILSLQEAVAAVVKSVYDEQDRVLREFATTGVWHARQWETPTVQGWADAQLRLQSFRARVFDEDLRAVAGEIRTTARSSIWAAGVQEAKESNLRLAELVEAFNEAVAGRLRDLHDRP